jgi:hypothetical protein
MQHIDLVPIWTAILAVGVFMYPERTREPAGEWKGPPHPFLPPCISPKSVA